MKYERPEEMARLGRLRLGRRRSDMFSASFVTSTLTTSRERRGRPFTVDPFFDRKRAGGHGKRLTDIGAQHDFGFARAHGVDQLKWEGAPAASKQAATAHDDVVRARDLRLVSDPLERAQHDAFMSEDAVSLRAGKKPAELVRALN
jgi:hypothetical protein